jgi:hypothetical protein
MRKRGAMSRLRPEAWLLTALLACSGVTDQLPPSPTAVTLGPAGGSVLMPDSVSVLLVPAGALAGDVAFTVTSVTGVPASGLLIRGTVYAIEPAVQFSIPATLRLSYARAALPPGVQESELAVHHVDGEWVEIDPSDVDLVGKTVQAAMTATDTVALLGRAATILSLSPAAADLFVGDSLHLTATALDAAGTMLAGRAIAWSSDNAAVANVRNDGTVVASGVGSASVSAYTDTARAVVMIEVTARPPQSALYPNQPNGAAVLMDYDTDFGQIGTPPWDFSSGAGNLATVTDVTAPVNPSAVGRVRFAPGCCGGAGPARLETYTGPGRGTPPPGWRRWYISDWVKLSSGWSPNAEGSQTIFRLFVNAGGGAGAWIAYTLDGLGPYRPGVIVDYPSLYASFGNGAVSALAGQWYHYETVVHNSGRIQFWVNNTLIYDGTPATVQFAGEFLQWSWAYGGVTPYGGSTDGYIYHNHIRTSYTTD